MTAAWTCGIQVGAHSWSIEQNIDEEVDDTPTVLDDLRFGWAMPGIYPAQPQAMSAEFSLNLPDFSDYGDLAKGDPVRIQLQVPSDGPVVASFHGRVTDLDGKPRDSHEDDTDGGVTLDVAAIDYTVDPAEQRIPSGPTVLPIPLYEYDVLQIAFYNGYGDSLPGDVDGIPDLWISPTDVEVPEDLLLGRTAFEQVAAILQQAVDTTSGGGLRLILSPIIAFGELPSVGRRFTVDTIPAYPDRDHVDLLLDAETVALDVAWTQVKGDAPDRVVATYGPSSLQEIATMAGATEPYVDIPLQLQLLDTNAARAALVAGFYLPADLEDNQWQVKSVTYLVDQLTEEQLDEFPTTLFPQWFTAEGDPDRSACYAKRVWVDNIEPTVQPYAAGPFSGLLVGATVQIRDGLVAIDLALRAVHHHDELPL